MFSTKSFVFSISELLNQTIFFEQIITKFQYKNMIKLMWKFKSKLTTVLWDFMKLHFVRILLLIWSHFINFTRWVIDEITDLNSIIFARSIEITSLLSFLQSCMNRICWNIYSMILSKWHSSTDETISICELNTSLLLLKSELGI